MGACGSKEREKKGNRNIAYGLSIEKPDEDPLRKEAEARDKQIFELRQRLLTSSLKMVGRALVRKARGPLAGAMYEWRTNMREENERKVRFARSAKLEELMRATERASAMKMVGRVLAEAMRGMLGGVLFCWRENMNAAIRFAMESVMRAKEGAAGLKRIGRVLAEVMRGLLGGVLFCWRENMNDAQLFAFASVMRAKEGAAGLKRIGRVLAEVMRGLLGGVLFCWRENMNAAIRFALESVMRAKEAAARKSGDGERQNQLAAALKMVGRVLIEKARGMLGGVLYQWRTTMHEDDKRALQEVMRAKVSATAMKMVGRALAEAMRGLLSGRLFCWRENMNSANRLALEAVIRTKESVVAMKMVGRMLAESMRGFLSGRLFSWRESTNAANRARDVANALHPPPGDAVVIHVMVESCTEVRLQDQGGLSSMNMGGFGGMDVMDTEPDPYVSVSLRNRDGSSLFVDGSRLGQLCTSVQENAADPMYNQGFEFVVDVARCTPGDREAELVLQVWDQNSAKDEMIASAKLPLSLATNEEGTQQVALTGDRVGGGAKANFRVETYSVEERQEVRQSRMELANQLETLEFMLQSCTDLQAPVLQAVMGMGGFGLDLGSVADPYVKIALKQPDGTVQEFQTATREGLDPEFGEHFKFETNVAQRTKGSWVEALLVVQVWHSRKMQSDQLMGHLTIPLCDICDDELRRRRSHSHTDIQTLELEEGQGKVHFTLNKSKKGKGKLKICRNPELQKPVVVDLMVERCSGVVDSSEGLGGLGALSGAVGGLSGAVGGPGGQTDPFVVVTLRHVGGARFYIDTYKMCELTTSRVESEHQPTFNQAFEFVLEAAHCVANSASGVELELLFEVLDRNSASSDNRIGTAVIPLSRALGAEGTQEVPLDRKGRVHFRIAKYDIDEWQATRHSLVVMAHKRETMQLELERCTNLHAPEDVMSMGVGGFGPSDLGMDLGSVADPYVKIALKQPDGTVQEFQTATREGLDPEFGEHFKFETNVAQRTKGSWVEALLVVQVWHSRKMQSDQLMGQTTMMLSDAIEKQGTQTIEFEGGKGFVQLSIVLV